MVAVSLKKKVIDEGSGIPPEQRTQVFDKYFQVEQKEAARIGYGLGLSFCKLAVEAHHGTIEVEDVPTGCSFRVVLPLIGRVPSANPSTS